MTNKERQKRYREKQKALRLMHDVTKKGENVTVDVTGGKKSVTLERYDALRYPVRAAWDIAVARARRARKYAEMFPHFVSEADKVFQTVEWQYENEGLKAVQKPETHLVR